MTNTTLRVRRLLAVVVLAAVIVVVVAATTGTSAFGQEANSPCNPETQPGASSTSKPYNPPHGADQPVTLTPTIGSQVFSFPLWKDLEQKASQISLTADKPMPIPADDLEVAIRGDMRRVDGNEIFPINQKAPQARFARKVGADGRLVTITVCIDPGHPVEAKPGRYQGTIVWDTSKATSDGVPLVTMGEVPVELTIRNTNWWLPLLVTIVAFLIGLLIKVVNDLQSNRDNAGRGRGGLRALLRDAPKSTESTPAAFSIGILLALGAAIAVYWKQYVQNPEFIGDIGGDMTTLFVAVFAAVVAAHTGVGAINGTVSRGSSVRD